MAFGKSSVNLQQSVVHKPNFACINVLLNQQFGRKLKFMDILCYKGINGMVFFSPTRYRECIFIILPTLEVLVQVRKN